MRKLLENLKQRWIAFRKTAGDLYDVFQPKNQVELVFRHASGPRKGEVAKRIKGRNVVTSWLSGAAGTAPTSGKDIMRRLIAPPTLTSGASTGQASNAVGTGAYIRYMMMGTSSTAEQSSDTGLVAANTGTYKEISKVEYDTANPYVTFTAEWDETEANSLALTEVCLLGGRYNGGSNPAAFQATQDFWARKTFAAFTKTSDFTLQVRWTIRF
jgi:hypothetical protein